MLKPKLKLNIVLGFCKSNASFTQLFFLKTSNLCLESNNENFETEKRDTSVSLNFLANALIMLSSINCSNIENIVAISNISKTWKT